MKTFTETELGTLEDLACVFKWLAQHENNCQSCITACLEAINHARTGEFEKLGDYKHDWPWMCQKCRESLNDQMVTDLQALNSLMRRYLTNKKQEKGVKTAIYHACRVAFNCGEKIPWHMVCHALRQGLGLESAITYRLQQKDFQKYRDLAELIQYLKDTTCT
jgi:hypothetical protein